MYSVFAFFSTTDVSSHYDNCDKYPLVCQNKCGKRNIKREDMDAHYSICPLETLKCPFKVCSKNIPVKIWRVTNEIVIIIIGHTPVNITVGTIWGNSHYDKCDQYPLECPNELADFYTLCRTQTLMQ